MRTDLKIELVLKALDMAVAQRRPHDVILHLDQGCHYKSIAIGLRCEHAGVRPSMLSVGEAYDNALCESFSLPPPTAPRLAVFDFIEGWYNPHRLYSGLGQNSPPSAREITLTPL